MKKLKKRQKKKLLAFITIGLIVLAFGIGYFVLSNNKPQEEQKEKEEQPQIKEPDPVVQIIDLTSNSRPYAVMINNNSAVWKYQSGLNEAYINYEMLVEGGITREMILFKDSQASKIQSIRSSRHYFLDYALENDAIYVHWGWSPQAQSDIRTLGINNINGLTYEGRYFFRDSTIKGIGSEHKGYSKMESLRTAAEKLKYRTTTESGNLLTYDARSLDLSSYEGVVDATTVEIPYSGGYTAKFFYDANTKTYLRTQNKTDLIDYNSGERVKTKNIIVYNVKYKTIDNYGRQDMENIGSGTGYFISEGKAVPIKWSKSSRAQKTIYTLSNGEPLVVNDGNTYIGLQPTGRTVKIVGPEVQQAQ